MKKIYSYFLGFILFFSLPVLALAQIQLSFTGIPTVTGTAGAVGAVYTYPSIGTTAGITIKATITIQSITGGATLNNIDNSGSGSANAWQPSINGSLTAGQCWGITFAINFFNATTNSPLTLSSFRTSGIDIDGDGNGGTLREYNTFFYPTSYTLENPTLLTVTQNAGLYTFTSPQSQISGIDITETRYIASMLYNNRSGIQVTLGSCCVGGACSATGTNRLHSINFFDAIPFGTAQTTLPVKLTSFTATKSSTGILLKWHSAEELNLSHYILQYSQDGISYSDLSTIPAEGSDRTYSYTDINRPTASKVYYRLKSVDIDGKNNFSRVLAITNEINSSGKKLIVFPNPVQQEMSINYTTDRTQPVAIRLINMDGKILQTYHRTAEKGTNMFPLTVPAGLPVGVYQLTVHDADGNISFSKIVKQ